MTLLPRGTASSGQKGYGVGGKALCFNDGVCIDFTKQRLTSGEERKAHCDAVINFPTAHLKQKPIWGATGGDCSLDTVRIELKMHVSDLGISASEIQYAEDYDSILRWVKGGFMHRFIYENFTNGQDIDVAFRTPLLLMRSAMTRLQNFWRNKIPGEQGAEDGEDGDADSVEKHMRRIVFRGMSIRARYWAGKFATCSIHQAKRGATGSPRQYPQLLFLSASKSMKMARTWAGENGTVMMISHTSGAFIYPIGEDTNWQMEVMLPAGIILDNLGCDRRHYIDSEGYENVINIIYMYEVTTRPALEGRKTRQAAMTYMQQIFEEEKTTCWPKECYEQDGGCCARGEAIIPYLPQRNTECVLRNMSHESALSARENTDTAMSRECRSAKRPRQPPRQEYDGWGSKLKTWLFVGLGSATVIAVAFFCCRNLWLGTSFGEQLQTARQDPCELLWEEQVHPRRVTQVELGMFRAEGDFGDDG